MSIFPFPNVQFSLPSSVLLELLNPGFETGDNTDWQTTTGTMQPLTTASGVSAPRSGLWMMWAGNVDGVNGNTFYKDFDITPWASKIDTGTCTITGLTAYHQTIASQGDNGDLLLEFRDAANAMTDAGHYIVGPSTQFGTGWNQRVMGTVTVPALTRHIRVGARNYIGVGPSIQSFWDDFTSPTLHLF